MPMLTSRNANSVPTFVRSTISSILMTAANAPTTTPVRIVVTWGVLNLGCTFAKTGGSSPSRAIEKNILGCPIWNTSSTAVWAITEPNATTVAGQVTPGGAAFCRAMVKGSACSFDKRWISSGYGINPAKTAPTMTYNTVQIMRDAIIPMGRSRVGFFVSSATVETASNPI